MAATSYLDKNNDHMWGNENSRSCVQRTFSKMNPGSLRGCIFTLMATAFGSGMLSIPWGIGQNGLVVGILMLFVASFVAYITLDCLSKISTATNSESYGEMVRKEISILTTIVIALYAFGTLITYNIIIMEIILHTLFKLGVSCDTLTTGKLFVALSVGICNFIDLPFFISRNISFLRYFTLLGTFFIFLISMIVVVQTPAFYVKNDPVFDILKFNIKGLLTFFSIAVYAFICHTNLVPVIYKLQNKTRGRVKKVTFPICFLHKGKNQVILRTVFFTAFVYFGLGLCGYFGFGNNVPSIIVFRKGITENDYLMTFGTFGFGIPMLFALPLNCFPGTENILSLIYPDGQRNRFVEPVVKLVFAYVPALIAVFFQDIIAAFSIIGGFCGAWIAILIPGMGYVKLLSSEKKCKRISFTIFTIFFTLLGFSSAGLNIVGLFSGNGSGSPTENICSK